MKKNPTDCEKLENLDSQTGAGNSAIENATLALLAAAAVLQMAKSKSVAKIWAKTLVLMSTIRNTKLVSSMVGGLSKIMPKAVLATWSKFKSWAFAMKRPDAFSKSVGRMSSSMTRTSVARTSTTALTHYDPKFASKVSGSMPKVPQKAGFWTRASSMGKKVVRSGGRLLNYVGWGLLALDGVMWIWDQFDSKDGVAPGETEVDNATSDATNDFFIDPSLIVLASDTDPLRASTVSSIVDVIRDVITGQGSSDNRDKIQAVLLALDNLQVFFDDEQTARKIGMAVLNIGANIFQNMPYTVFTQDVMDNDPVNDCTGNLDKMQGLIGAVRIYSGVMAEDMGIYDATDTDSLGSRDARGAAMTILDKHSQQSVVSRLSDKSRSFSFS
jgi:hypothetical protein